MSADDTRNHLVDGLRANGADPEALGDVLDFGCGSGRLLRHWKASDRLRLHGTDYNADLIAWCQRHYRFARFSVNPLAGPLPYPDASFDFFASIGCLPCTRRIAPGEGPRAGRWWGLDKTECGIHRPGV